MIGALVSDRALAQIEATMSVSSASGARAAARRGSYEVVTPRGPAVE